jgi:fatty acid desaturase
MVMHQTIVADRGASSYEQPRLYAATTRIEWPTVAVACAAYAGYIALTWFFRALPLWIAAPLCAICLTWFGSFQHETIHGHPTPWRLVNRALASVPLSLWIPYRLYRATHLKHHRHGGRHLTDAIEDPESFYMSSGALSRCGYVRRALYGANCTLVGRLTLGPALSVCRFWHSEIREFIAGDRRRATVWAGHVTVAALVVLWVTQVCHIPFAQYLVLIIYPSISLTHLRSFAEHRADPNPALRTQAVECSRFLALLFLNNNLHIAHHAYPKLPWYQLPNVWRQMRGRAVNSGLVFTQGYRRVGKSYLFKPVMSVEQPAKMCESTTRLLCK